jgi:hypothetical protein
MSPMQCTSMTKKIYDNTVRLLVALKLSHGRLYMIRSILLLLPLVQSGNLCRRIQPPSEFNNLCLAYLQKSTTNNDKFACEEHGANGKIRNMLASRRRQRSLILQVLLCWSFQRINVFRECIRQTCTGSLSRTTSRKPMDDRKLNRFDIHNGGAPCAGSAHDGVEEEDPMTKCTRWRTCTIRVQFFGNLSPRFSLTALNGVAARTISNAMKLTLLIWQSPSRPALWLTMSLIHIHCLAKRGHHYGCNSHGRPLGAGTAGPCRRRQHPLQRPSLQYQPMPLPAQEDHASSPYLWSWTVQQLPAVLHLWSPRQYYEVSFSWPSLHSTSV